MATFFSDGVTGGTLENKWSRRWVVAAAAYLFFSFSAVGGTFPSIEKLGCEAMVTIHYAQGAVDLTAEAQNEIRSLLSQAGDFGRIRRVIVAAWADEEFPRTTFRLSHAQRRLASQRARNIKHYLINNLGLEAPVETHTMSEQASWVERVLDTPDAKLKRVLVPNGHPPLEAAENFYQVHKMARKAMVIVDLHDH